MASSAAGGPRNSVLFVCLGNICRSPIAEAVFRHLIRQQGVESEWLVDSCGTIDYHSGKAPDSRARKVLQEKGVEYEHKARVIRKEDFSKFQYIMGMDLANIEDLEDAKPRATSTAKIHRLGEFDKTPQGLVKDVRDPYYDSGDEGFYKCYDQCMKACEGFLTLVEEENKNKH